MDSLDRRGERDLLAYPSGFLDHQLTSFKEILLLFSAGGEPFSDEKSVGGEHPAELPRTQFQVLRLSRPLKGI